MGTILITGAGGLIGTSLSRTMATKHDILGLDFRKPEGLDIPFAVGRIGSSEDLQQLDQYDIDVVIHLAAMKSQAPEPDIFLVNVEGTRCLLRYLIDRGCRKFVLASSIAAVGVRSLKFRPMQLPIPEEHACVASDAYGFSKYMMEELTRYFARQNEDLDFINIRLGVVVDDSEVLDPERVGPLTEWAAARVSKIFVSDVIRAFTLAAVVPRKSGVRVMNAVGGQACVQDPVPDIIRAWYPKIVGQIDLSHYMRPGHERDPLFDITKIKEEIGFVPDRQYIQPK